MPFWAFATCHKNVAQIATCSFVWTMCGSDDTLACHYSSDFRSLFHFKSSFEQRIWCLLIVTFINSQSHSGTLKSSVYRDKGSTSQRTTISLPITFFPGARWTPFRNRRTVYFHASWILGLFNELTRSPPLGFYDNVAILSLVYNISATVYDLAFVMQHSKKVEIRKLYKKVTEKLKR